MLSRHPEEAKLAQAEIDSVTSIARLPDFDDRPGLPYVDYILKEVYRINAPVPLGIPHRASITSDYRGWTIPEGSLVLPNMWQMLRDEQYFKNPGVFSPSRFKPPDAEMLTGLRKTVEGFSVSGGADDPAEIVFGFGRRACPGRFFADASLWLAIARILAVFDILPESNPAMTETDKQPVTVEMFTNGTTSRPKPFTCRIVPRSDKHASLLADSTS